MEAGTTSSRRYASQGEGHRFYVFGRYEFYDSMFDTAKSVIRQGLCRRQRVAVGFNYYPIKNIVIKVEHGIGLPGSYDYTDSPPGETRTGVSTTSPPFRWGRLLRLFSDVNQIIMRI